MIKWILCLIGGLPLLQTIAITFTGAPIPFAKIGGFPPAAIQEIINKIEQAIKDGKSWLNGLKDEFVNPLKAELDRATASLREFTDNNFSRLKETLPGLYSRSGVVANARSRLETVLGYATDNQILGMTVNQWSMLGNTLYDATQTYKNHTDEISGVQTDDKVLTLQTLYGNVVFSGATINIAASNTFTVNLAGSTVYPKINVGTTILIDSEEKIVLGKTYTTTSGDVSINTISSNVTVTSSNVSALNLANVIVGTGTIKLSSGMYIRVNSEIKQIESINSFGDFLTVASPFRNSNTNATLFVETGYTVNSVFANTKTDISVAARSQFIANSLCLSNVITGNGTSFTSVLSVGDKIYYDEKEFFVESVTDTEISVDEPLQLTVNEVVYKVTDEQPVVRIVETNSPDDVLALFDEIGQLTNGLDRNILDGLTTRYRRANGSYATIDISTPSKVTSSLQNRQVVNAVTRTIQKLIDDFQDDAIAALSDTELANYLDELTNEIDELRKSLKEEIDKDLAGINALKGIVKGLIKLFIASCSKKKKGANPEDPDTSSDVWLNLILKPNPVRQGCAATESDLPALLDEADEQFRSVQIPDVNTDVPVFEAQDPRFVVDGDDGNYPLQPTAPAGGAGDVGIDSDPEGELPPKPVDPCTQPC